MRNKSLAANALASMRLGRFSTLRPVKAGLRTLLIPAPRRRVFASGGTAFPYANVHEKGRLLASFFSNIILGEGSIQLRQPGGGK